MYSLFFFREATNQANKTSETWKIFCLWREIFLVNKPFWAAECCSFRTWNPFTTVDIDALRQPWYQAHTLSQRAARCVIEGVMHAFASGAVQTPLTGVCFFGPLSFYERGRIHSTRLIAAPSLAKQRLSIWGAAQTYRRTFVHPVV